MNLNKRLDKAMLATIFALAWPTMLEQFMQTAVQYIDTAMVGSLGTDATAAVGSTSTINWMVMSTISAIGVGFLAIISQSLGAGDEIKAKKASAQAVLITLIAGTLFTIFVTSISSYVPVLMQVDENIRDIAARYFLIVYSPLLFRSFTVIFGTVLRAAGDTKTPMKAGIAVNLVNVILNYLLIYPVRDIKLFGIKVHMIGAGLGVNGAAYATAASYITGGVILSIVLLRHPKISPIGMSFKPDKEILGKAFKIAIPNMIQRFITTSGYVVFAAMINSLGEVSAAAHTIANTVESAFYIPGYGMQAAAATLAGNAYGSKDNEKLERLGKSILILEVSLMIISGGALFILAEPFMHIFSKDMEVIVLGATVLRMVSLSEPIYGVPIVCEGLMMGLGETKIPMIFNVFGMWAVRILGTFICTRFFSLGLISAWSCMIGHNCLLFILFGWYYLTGKWNPLKEKQLKRSVSEV